MGAVLVVLSSCSPSTPKTLGVITPTDTRYHCEFYDFNNQMIFATEYAIGINLAESNGFASVDGYKQVLKMESRKIKPDPVGGKFPIEVRQYKGRDGSNLVIRTETIRQIEDNNKHLVIGTIHLMSPDSQDVIQISGSCGG